MDWKPALLKESHLCSFTCFIFPNLLSNRIVVAEKDHNTIFWHVEWTFLFNILDCSIHIFDKSDHFSKDLSKTFFLNIVLRLNDRYFHHFFTVKTCCIPSLHPTSFYTKRDECLQYFLGNLLHTYLVTVECKKETPF